MKYTARQIKAWDVQVSPHWHPARPLNYQHESWISRIKHAIGVLFGKYDALDWEK